MNLYCSVMSHCLKSSVILFSFVTLCLVTGKAIRIDMAPTLPTSAQEAESARNQPLHPFGHHLLMRDRMWTSMNYPRLERNFCCCLCLGNTNTPTWYLKEVNEKRCSFDMCQATFEPCGHADKIVYMGNTGPHDAFNSPKLTRDMIISKCQSNRVEASSWWDEFHNIAGSRNMNEVVGGPG